MLLTKYIARKRILWLAIVSVATLQGQHAIGAPFDDRGVTLLVHGVVPIPHRTAGENAWCDLPTGDGNAVDEGFVGCLVRCGLKFGGILRSRGKTVQLPDDLEPIVDRGSADVYVLTSSMEVQLGDITDQARELASAVNELCRYTGTRRVKLVTFSQGGLAARIWLQGALSDCPYESGRVEQLCTVATPHCGVAGWPEWAGKLWKSRFGTLTVGSELLQKLNRDLDLPVDVRYVSIIVQGPHVNLFDHSSRYQPWLNVSQEQIGLLPRHLREGGDGVVHALSAQLNLTPVASRYEAQTGRHIEALVCWVEKDTKPGFRLSHSLAPRHPVVWNALLRCMTTPHAPATTQSRGLHVSPPQMFFPPSHATRCALGHPRATLAP